MHTSRFTHHAARFGPPLLFTLLSAIFLWQPLVTGDVFLPTDLAYKHDDVWKVQSPEPGFRVAQNELLSDVSLYYYPYAHYAMERLSQGEFPLWNPYMLGGAPFFAAAQGAVLDPINLLTFTAGPLAYWTWGAFIRLALLGYGFYGFLRALGRGMAGALAGGVTFMLGGFVTVWLNYSVVSALTWVPLLFWATTRLLQTGRAVWMAATGAAMGALLLGGHPETQFLAGLAWGFFVLYGLTVALDGSPGRASRFIRRGLLLLGAVALGMGVAAVQTLTFVPFLLESSAFSERLAGTTPFDLGNTAFRLAVTLFPNFGGTPIQGNYWVPTPINTNFNDQMAYPGLLALALAAMVAVSWLKRGRGRDHWPPFFIALGLVSLYLGVRAPGSSLVRELPLFNVGHGVRWGETLLLCVAALSAWGVDSLAEMRARTKRARDAGLWLAAMSLAAFGVLLLVYIGLRDWGWDAGWRARLDHASLTRFFHPASLTVYWPVLFLVAGTVVMLVRWRGWLRAGGAATLLVLLIYAELWAFGSRYNPVTPSHLVYPPTPTTRFLADNLGHERFAGLLNTLRPNASMLFGLRDLRGFEDVTYDRVARLLGRHARGASLNSGKGDFHLTPDEHRVLSVGGVKYLLTVRKPRVVESAAPYRYVQIDNRVAIYENLEALPRARFVAAARFAHDGERAAQMLLSPEYDPRRSVIVTGAGNNLESTTSRGAGGSITWLLDEPERVSIQLDAPQSGYLVLSDTHAPGWEATLDGAPTPILKADVIYRAVAVSAGRHTIEFVYRPALFYWGALVSGLSAIVILLIALAALVRRNPKPQNPNP